MLTKTFELFQFPEMHLREPRGHVVKCIYIYIHTNLSNAVWVNGTDIIMHHGDPRLASM